MIFKNEKTIMFASLIVVILLPLSNIGFAAEDKPQEDK